MRVEWGGAEPGCLGAPTLGAMLFPRLPIRITIWLSLVCFGCALGTAVFAQAPPPSPAPRPNVLVLLADDWSYPHAGHLGDPVVRTPHLDRLASEGVVFGRAFVASPSCTPSRAALLTGRHVVALGAGGSLYGPLDTSYANYATALAAAGYHVGKSRKGWSPGRYEVGGYTQNPAGADYPDFAAFRAAGAADQPWCFWFGSQDPHRDYEAGSGSAAGLRAADVEVLACWPDVPAVREDVLDYYAEVERFDRDCGAILDALRESGELARTLVIVTSDNGMPFPRGKANLYDLGTRVPLAVSWPDGNVAAGSRQNPFVSLVDLAPTILGAAGLPIPAMMQGTSLLPLLRNDDAADGTLAAARPSVFVARERHANVRASAESYPMRAVRMAGFLYVRNYFPERWPAGDPEVINTAIGPYGDVDDSPTKRVLLHDYRTAAGAHRYNLSFGRRPAEELYDMARDPDQLVNVASDPAYARTLDVLRNELATHQYRYGDPRAQSPRTMAYDRYPYTFPLEWAGELGRDR